MSRSSLWKRTIEYGLGAALATFMLAGCGEDGSGVIARVDSESLDRDEFDQRVRSALIENGMDPSQAGAAQLGQAQQMVLENMISQSLMVQAAEDAGMTVSPDELELELSFARARFASRSEFAAELERRGIDEEDYLTNLGRELLIQKYVETELAADIEVTDGEVRGYYDRHPEEFNREERLRVRQLLLETKNGSSEADRRGAREAAERALNRIKSGEDFAKLATEVATDGSASNGGDLGSVSVTELVPALAAAVGALDVGDVSPVIETRFGYHVLRIETREPAHNFTFAEAQEMIRQEIFEQRKRGRRDNWIKGLRAEARVQILDASLAGGAANS